MANESYEGQEFLYRPIPMLIPISMGFVFLSLTAAMIPELLVIPVLGIILAALAWRQIQRSHGNLSGAWMAIGSIAVQTLIAVSFAAMHAYSFATEVPPGFERVNFVADIAKKGFVSEGGMTGLHPDVQKLIGKKVMIKGYMYPSKTIDGIRQFVLCKDNDQCCFGGQPKTTDMVLIRMNGDKTAHYKTGLVAVAGVFQAQHAVDESGLEPVYQLECDVFGPAKTWY
jgi:hypothetical protein